MSDEADGEEPNPGGGWLFNAVLTLISLVVVILVLAILGLLIALIVRALTVVVADPALAFTVIGDNATAIGAWAAAFVGLFTVIVLALTNRTRAKEAVRNDFREFMEWALENLNQNDDKAAKLFAFNVVEQFVESPPKFLDKRSWALAEKVYQVAVDKEHKEMVKKEKEKVRKEDDTDVDKPASDTDN